MDAYLTVTERLAIANQDPAHPMCQAGFRYSAKAGQWYDPAGSDGMSQRINIMESVEKEILAIGNAAGVCHVKMETWHNGDCWNLTCNGEVLAESSYWNTYPVQLNQSGTHYHKSEIRAQLQRTKAGGGNPYPFMSQGGSNFTAKYEGELHASNPHLAFFLAIARGEEPQISDEERNIEMRMLSR
jgi:hypothetical protein